MDFHCLDHSLSAVRHIRILLLWTLKRRPFCRIMLCNSCKLAWHSCEHFDGSFLFGQKHLRQLAKWGWVVPVGEFLILYPKYCREYVRERLGLAHRLYFCDKKYCSWGPQFWRICATMICARLSESSMPVWLTHEMAQVAQLFERAI